MSYQKEALQELAKRELEKRYKPEREDLIEFIKTYFKEESPKGIENFEVSPFHLIIADALKRVIKWECNRLIINIPPWHGKTELVTKCFPVWGLWNNPHLQIISTGYSTSLTQWFSQEAKDYYKSATFKKIFPRYSAIRKDQDTKEHWTNEKWGSYYSTGTSGTITGKRANLFLIDDPIKPNEADKSEVIRVGINNWYDNTVLSRLFKPSRDSVIIIMQRTHEDDLCGHLISKMEEWGGEDWEVLSLPAVAEDNEVFDTEYGIVKRAEWVPLDLNRYWLAELDALKKGLWNTNFNCQYQQNPTSKENQEFHEEWFKYYDNLPEWGRTFTTVDPAFSKKASADDSAVTTVKFVWDKLYILEQTAWKWNPAELEDKIIYHTKKWNPERIWVEAVAAQVTIWFSLRNRLKKEWLYKEVEDIRQKWDKEAKIRALIPLYRNGQIFHNRELAKLENQLQKFPRGKHDDCADWLQMCYYMYDLSPNTASMYKIPKITYNKHWQPVIN